MAACVDAGCNRQLLWADGSLSSYEIAESEPCDIGLGGFGCAVLSVRPDRDPLLTWTACEEEHTFVCAHCGPVPGPIAFEAREDAGMAAWDAEVECISRGGHLASVHSQTDNDIIMSMIDEDGDRWIGFTTSTTRLAALTTVTKVLVELLLRRTTSNGWTAATPTL